MDEQLVDLMNKVKFFILLVLVVGILFIATSCGNRQVGIDTNQSFTRAYIKLGNTVIETTVKAWRDFENGDEIQIVANDGTVYLTHYANVVMMSK